MDYCKECGAEVLEESIGLCSLCALSEQLGIEYAHTTKDD